MSLMGWLVILGGVLVVGLLLYWQLVITEGAYLGARLVILLYDLTAHRYNAIKEFNQAEEDICLGRPLMHRLYAHPQATVLDVATGTGRLPLVLLRQPGFTGCVVGVDRSVRMLAVARQDLAHYGERVALVVADAMALPFASQCLPAVTCLEALEFLPDPKGGLAELVRVLQPVTDHNPSRGWLLTTNRVGWEASLMPGKSWSRQQLEAILAEFPLSRVEINIWQDIYDQVWAQKIDSGKETSHGQQRHVN